MNFQGTITSQSFIICLYYSPLYFRLESLICKQDFKTTLGWGAII